MSVHRVSFPQTGRRWFRAAWSLVPLCCLSLGGCGRDYSVVPVSGTVTRGDTPVANATVRFQPKTEGGSKANPGPGSYGKTDENGKYVLEVQTEAGLKGAVPGKHKVTIETGGPASEKALADDSVMPISTDIPAAFRKGVMFEVPAGGTDQADFDLNNPPPPAQ